jgi:hypothetical protein
MSFGSGPCPVIDIGHIDLQAEESEVSCVGPLSDGRPSWRMTIPRAHSHIHLPAPGAVILSSNRLATM